MSSKSKFSSQLGLKMCCFFFPFCVDDDHMSLPCDHPAVPFEVALNFGHCSTPELSIFNLEQTIFTTNSFQCTVRLCSSAPFVSLPEKPKPKAKTKHPSPRTHDLVEGVFKGVVKEEVASELGGC